MSSVSPSSGTAAGGTSVTITGTNYASGDGGELRLDRGHGRDGGTATSITATAPAGTGAVDVTVTGPGGSSAVNAGDKYTYVPAPTVSSISPTSGPAAGGTSVTITGTGFVSGDTVKFGSAAATSVTVVSATSITATSPAGTGAVDVTVTDSLAQTSATSAGDKFTYNGPPTVSAISPASGPTAGGTLVTITGSNYASGDTVSFGSSAATGVTVASATSLTATSPAGRPGRST